MLEDLNGAQRPVAGPLLDWKGVNVATKSAAFTMTFSDAPVQKLTFTGGNQNVNLPSVSSNLDGAGFWIYNAGASNSGVVKTSGGSTLATLAPGDLGFFQVTAGVFVAAMLIQLGTSVSTGSITATSGLTAIAPITFKDSSDVTKLLSLVMSSIGTGQTRVLTMANFDVNLNTGPFTENTDVVIPVSTISFTAVADVWTRSRSAAADYKIARNAGASVGVLAVEVPTLVLRSTASKGRKITGLKIKYAIATAAANDVTVSVGYTVVPANASAVAAASNLGSITYDANHDTSAKRKTVAEHTMQVTFGSPVYLADAVGFEILITVDAALTTAFSVSQIELLASETLIDAT